MMQAGKLRHRITITAVQLERQRDGSTRSTPGEAVNVLAAVEPLPAAETVRNGLTATDAAYRVTIRYRPEIDEKASIAYGDATLAIVSVTPGGQGNREWLMILAKVRR